MTGALRAAASAGGLVADGRDIGTVVFPEAEVGERVAHLLTGKMIDFIEFDDGFAIVKTRAPVEAHGRNLGEASLDEFTQTKSVWMKVG